MGNVWSELRKQQNKKPSVWDNVKPEPKKRVAKTSYSPPRADNTLPPQTIVFDLETGSADDMWKRSDPEFIRLCGWSIDDGEVFTDPLPIALIEDIYNTTGWIVGHNIMEFDNILLDKMLGVSILELARQERLRDTKLLTFLADPPYSRTKIGEIRKYYSLENQGTLYLGEGKLVDVTTGNSVLKELAKEFGGYDQIPVDNERYNKYLRRDVEATRDLIKVVPINDYAIREHKIAAVCATISTMGFKVDIPLLKERIKAGEDKRIRILTELHGLGLPSPESTKAPHRTKVGITVIDTAFSDLGVELPRSEKTGRPVMGKPVLEALIEEHGDGKVSDLAEAIMSLNGIRTIYGNIYDNLIGDRVHPKIDLRQSSGRLSITDPGLTVIGKRAGKVTERAVFLPDEGCVLISCDLAQVDARMVAGLSQDLNYLALFEDGRDYHAEMALRIFGSTDFREKAKATVHGIPYGMQAKKLAWSTGMPLHEAEEILYTYSKNFPRLMDWQREVRETGEVEGILYNGFGRLMKIEKERSFTQAPALMGQSSARDVLMEGVLRLWEMGGERVIKMIRGIIHDELIMSIPIQEVEEIEHLVVEALSFPWCPVGGKYAVQIEAGLNERGTNWAKCYDKK